MATTLRLSRLRIAFGAYLLAAVGCARTVSVAVPLDVFPLKPTEAASLPGG